MGFPDIKHRCVKCIHCIKHTEGIEVYSADITGPSYMPGKSYFKCNILGFKIVDIMERLGCVDFEPILPKYIQDWKKRLK